MATPKMSLKLLFDTTTRKVIFAEAGKDFVDFLFHILSLPVGSILKPLITNETTVSCIGNLYRSIENLNEAYMQPNQNKDLLLKPNAPDSSAVKKFYNCGNNHRYVTNDFGLACPACRNSMGIAVPYVSLGNVSTSSSGEGDYVKGLITYMVTDDLLVMPISMITAIAMMKKCEVLGFDTLEEKMVEFGIDELPKLLKASLESKAALTNVFLGDKQIEIKDGTTPK